MHVAFMFLAIAGVREPFAAKLAGVGLIVSVCVHVLL